MGDEAFSRAMMEQTSQLYTYAAVETTAEIAAMVQHLTTMCVEQVALVTINLSFEIEGRMSAGRSTADPYTSTICLLNNLRRLVRKTDVVFLLGHTLYFLL